MKCFPFSSSLNKTEFNTYMLEYMSSLDQVMACHLFDTKPLPEASNAELLSIQPLLYLTFSP